MGHKIETVGIWLRDAMDAAGIEPRSYSGRGMYGKTCLAFDTDSPFYDVAQIVASVENDEAREDVAQVFKGARTDSMGLSSVVYFPKIDWTE